jgi:hypothetical protein
MKHFDLMEVLINWIDKDHREVKTFLRCMFLCLYVPIILPGNLFSLYWYVLPCFYSYFSDTVLLYFSFPHDLNDRTFKVK